MRFSTIGSLAFSVALAATAHSANACIVTLDSDGKTYPTIAAAFAAGQMSDKINIDGAGGPCNENLLFTNNRVRIILQGSNGAVIRGNSASPVIDSRTKGIAIINMTISGGYDGITIRRNANAIIDTVTVQGAVNHGISLNEQAFAVVMASTIQNNGNNGITLARQASANIGFNNATDSVARGNTIANNGTAGIALFDGSSAYISSNVIFNNRNHGVFVGQLSVGRISNNDISLNGLDGVSVTGNSYAQLGGYTSTPSHFLDYPNKSTSLNGQFGVSCYSNSTVEGHLGAFYQLRGVVSQFGGGADAYGVNNGLFSPNCGRAAAFLQVP